MTTNHAGAADELRLLRIELTAASARSGALRADVDALAAEFRASTARESALRERLYALRAMTSTAEAIRGYLARQDRMLAERAKLL